MWRTKAIGLAAAAALLLGVPASAGADTPYPKGPFAQWDGTNPFNCTLHDFGTGPAVDTGDDPFCVEFDKTQQNITDLGIFEFIANEPARFGAAGTKCFYYQTDHWTGSVVQGEPPEVWHWDGQYFFDKAHGIGGVNIQNFRVFGQPASPAEYGEVPPEYAPYFDQSGGGSYLIADVDADPSCVAKVDTPEEEAQIYSNGPPPEPQAPTPGGSGAPAQNAAGPGAVTISRPGCTRKKHKRHRKRPARCRSSH